MTQLVDSPIERTLTIAHEEIRLRRVKTIHEYRQCEALQTRVWGANDVVGVPLLDLITAQENGGLVLGAFTATNQLIGMVYSFLGLAANARLKQCSILAGVDPAYQHYAIGHHLKLMQREATLAMGLDLITWTFDPLVSMNAYLNFRKLGTISSTYLVNHYGETQGLNAGLETDRLLVEWHLSKPLPATSPLPSDGLGRATPVNEIALDPATGLPIIHNVALDRSDPALLLEIPNNIHSIKAQDLALARRWRTETRAIFQRYLAQGYLVCGFDRSIEGDLPRCRYLLQRSEGP